MIQRLAVQGAELEATDVIVGGPKDPKENNSSEEEWSVIDLKDENCLLNKENSNPKHKSKQGSSAMKQIKGAASVLSFVSSHKPGKNRTGKSIFDSPASNLNSTPSKSSSSVSSKIEFGYSFWKNQKSEEKSKRKPFRTLFRGGGGGGEAEEGGEERSGKKKNGDCSDDDTAPLPLNERSDSETHMASSWTVTKLPREEEEEDNSKVMKKKLHSDGFPHKV